jgi:hypothetical protein
MNLIKIYRLLYISFFLLTCKYTESKLEEELSELTSEPFRLGLEFLDYCSENRYDKASEYLDDEFYKEEDKILFINSIQKHFNSLGKRISVKDGRAKQIVNVAIPDSEERNTFYKLTYVSEYKDFGIYQFLIFRKNEKDQIKLAAYVSAFIDKAESRVVSLQYGPNSVLNKILSATDIDLSDLSDKLIKKD